MLGVIANPIAILVGACLGLVFKRWVSDAVVKLFEQALGFCIIMLGIRMAMKFDHALVMIGCVTIGGLIGTWLRIEARTAQLGQHLQRLLKMPGQGNFAYAFSTTSILYCTGAMAVIGSINSGASGDNEVLFAKSMMDGMFSVPFAAMHGAGVAFSAIPVFLYQGAIALAASRLHGLARPEVLNDVSGVGGVLLAMIGVSMTGIKKVPVGDYLPAILLSVLLAVMA